MYISSLTTANVNLFVPGPPLLPVSSTPVCMSSKTGQKHRKKNHKSAPQYKRTPLYQEGPEVQIAGRQESGEVSHTLAPFLPSSVGVCC